MNTVFQRCVNYALKKVCFHNTPWCVNLHTPKTHLIMCYFKDKRCVWRTHHGVFWEHTCFYSVCANKLSFNVKKSSYVIFHPRQKRAIASDFNLVLVISTETLQSNTCINCVGIYIDSRLSWKTMLNSLPKNSKETIGLLSKMHHYVTINILKDMYYSLIYHL